HDPARAQRIAHALVDAVLQRDIDVELEGLQPADPRAVDDIVGAFQRLAAVSGGRDGCRQLIGLKRLNHEVQRLLL
ncbi:hypothetical protein LCGC14_2940830, partial [marine sediment metagenome]